MHFSNSEAVSLEDCEGEGPERARRINGELVSNFLKNVQVGNRRESATLWIPLVKVYVLQATGDAGALVLLGLWGRCDGRPDHRLYGQVRDTDPMEVELLAI